MDLRLEPENLKNTGTACHSRPRHAERERFILIRERADGGQDILDVRIFVSSATVNGKRLPGAAASIIRGSRAPGDRIVYGEEYKAKVEHLERYDFVSSQWAVFDPATPGYRSQAKTTVRRYVYALLEEYRKQDAFLAAYAKQVRRRPYALSNNIYENWRIPRSKVATYRADRTRIRAEAAAKAEARAAIDKDFSWVNDTVKADIPTVESREGGI